MNLQNLKSLFIDNGCTKIYIKKLSPNDNSKNQVYFGGSFEILNILPISEKFISYAEELKGILDEAGITGTIFSGLRLE